MLARLATAAVTALVVAFLEELLFRGALFGGLRRAWSMPAALLVSSLIYAILHFPHRTEVLTEVTWYTGFLVLPQMLRGYVDLQHIMPGFLFLTAAGMIFGLAYYRTGTLYASMGLHAGAIVVIKLYGSIHQAERRRSVAVGHRQAHRWLAAAGIHSRAARRFPAPAAGAIFSADYSSKRRRDRPRPGAHGPPQTLMPAGMRRAEI